MNRRPRGIEARSEVDSSVMGAPEGESQKDAPSEGARPPDHPAIARGAIKPSPQGSREGAKVCGGRRCLREPPSRERHVARVNDRRKRLHKARMPPREHHLCDERSSQAGPPGVQRKGEEDSPHQSLSRHFMHEHIFEGRAVGPRPPRYAAEREALLAAQHPAAAIGAHPAAVLAALNLLLPIGELSLPGGFFPNLTCTLHAPAELRAPRRERVVEDVARAAQRVHRVPLGGERQRREEGELAHIPADRASGHVTSGGQLQKRLGDGDARRRGRDARRERPLGRAVRLGVRCARS